MNENSTHTAVEPSEIWGDMPIELVHIIAQAFYHAPAFIVGNKAGLVRLRCAIDEALQTSGPVEVELCCQDGEGYGLAVRCVPTDAMADQPLGYTDRDICPDNGKWPDWMRGIA